MLEAQWAAHKETHPPKQAANKTLMKQKSGRMEASDKAAESAVQPRANLKGWYPGRIIAFLLERFGRMTARIGARAEMRAGD